jgi:hypothetical protein
LTSKVAQKQQSIVCGARSTPRTDYADAMFNLALLLQRGSRHKEAASNGGNILPMMLYLNGQRAHVDP